MHHCSICPRACHAPREALRGEGRCGMGWLPRIARSALHFWEEPCISGTRGSGTIFFCGCSLGCAYCQNREISRCAETGIAVTAQEVADAMRRLQDEGAHNINLVTGGHFLPAIVEALKPRPVRIPIVYNTSAYETVEALRGLDGLIDIYLPDYKYADAWSAGRYSDAPDYPTIAQAAIREMVRQVGQCETDEEGLLTRGVLVRHLVLPGHVQASRDALDWLDAELPRGVWFSLLGQYMPMGSGFSEIERKVTRREYERVCAHFEQLDRKGYAQSVRAAEKAYLPAFDGTGVQARREMEKP